jgi:glycopeptide antibiotics resistance protein
MVWTYFYHVDNHFVCKGIEGGSGMLQINRDKALYLSKKALVMLPAIVIILMFSIDHLTLYRHTEMHTYSLERYINVFPFLVFVFWNALKKEQKTFIDVAMQSSFNIYLYAVLLLTIFYIPFIVIFKAMISGLWFESLIVKFIIYYDHGLQQGINLIPLQKFAIYGLMDRQILGNLMLLFPLGFFLPLLYKVSSIKKFIFISFLITLFIEVTQLFVSFVTPWTVVYARSFDVDDLILNTLGAVAGYYAFIAIQSGLKKKKKMAEGISSELEEGTSIIDSFDDSSILLYLEEDCISDASSPKHPPISKA